MPVILMSMAVLLTASCRRAESAAGRQSGQNPAKKKAGAPSAAAPEKPAKTYALPGQEAELARAMDLEVVEIDVYNTHVRVSNVKEPATVSIPAGTLVMVGEDKLPPFLVVKDTSFTAKSGKPQIFKLSSVSTTWEFAKKTATVIAPIFQKPRRVPEFRFSLAAGPDERPDVRFVKASAGQKLPWNVVQAGVWAINDNLTLRQLGQYQVSESRRFGEVSTTLDSPETIRKIEQMIVAAGLNPLDYRVFKDQEEARVKKRQRMDELLKQADFDAPSGRYLDAVYGLGEFEGEMAASDLLWKYYTAHPDPAVREVAFESLARAGLPDAPEILLVKATEDAQPDVRFLAAMTLFQKGEPRGYPLLAVYLTDPRYAKFKHLGKIGEKFPKDGKYAAPTEPLLAYWEKVYGWKALEAEFGDVSLIRKAVDGFQPGLSTPSPSSTGPAAPPAGTTLSPEQGQVSPEPLNPEDAGPAM